MSATGSHAQTTAVICCFMRDSSIYCAKVSVTETEIASQPEKWRLAADLLPEVEHRLPRPGSRVAVIGCGTSYFIAQAVAQARESLHQGETDAFVASEMPAARHYDLVVAISRSGTTTEVVRALQALPEGVQSLAISAVPDTPVVRAAGEAVLLEFADEESIVQTRFATSVLALMRAHLGQDLAPVIADARAALSRPLPVEPADFEQFVFLGRGWTVGLAAEAALKFREAAGAWTESYHAMEYRHGPISVAGTGTLVWFVSDGEPALVDDVRATGATVVVGTSDPMAELVTLQQMAVALAHARGLDPDRPAHLTRSVVLP
jgi:fructoselysine-6-P-deglycase FrlB-like protein